jgi:hypothetical protein
MKLMLSSIAGCMLLTTSCLANWVAISLTSTNGQVQISVNSKALTRHELQTLLGKLAELQKDQLLHVILDKNVPATSLLQLLHDIQSKGLHNLVLIAPAEENGKKGGYQITVDAIKRKFGGCSGGEMFESGFHEEPEYDIERFERALATLSDSADIAQTTNAPLPRPAQPRPEKR